MILGLTLTTLGPIGRHHGQTGDGLRPYQTGVGPHQRQTGDGRRLGQTGDGLRLCLIGVGPLPCQTGDGRRLGQTGGGLRPGITGTLLSRYLFMQHQFLLLDGLLFLPGQEVIVRIPLVHFMGL